MDSTTMLINGLDTIKLLKHEAIDRLDSVVDDLPKYKKNLKELIANFTVDDMLYLINTIYRDTEFKSSLYYKIYNEYFDEIEELIHIMMK
uniref:Uncharacterized protein n=1 Tax=viral metagenome TaxID=1070528 RepID=A0A6C0IJY2_9ZZZZ